MARGCRGGTDPASRGRDALAGLRTGFNSGESQTVFAVAVPIERIAGHSTLGLIVYLSYELPFTH